MNTTQVPTEWLEELIRLNGLAESQINIHDLTNFETAICFAKLIGHAKAAKYINQPQPDIVELINPSELLMFVKNHYEGSFYTFSEVLEAFKKSKG
jgi:hypothetical protein